MFDQIYQMPELSISDRFRRMADQIDHNATGSFAGAYVIVPPALMDEGAVALFPPIEVLVLDTSQSPVQFLQMLSSKVAIALEHVKAQEARAAGYGR